MSTAQGLRVARAVYGGGLLLAPVQLLCALARMPLDRPTVNVARVLGARHLAQAALTRRGTAVELGLGAAVDAAHAGSMAAMARWSSRRAHRVLAARDARTAALLAVLGAAASTTRRRRS